MGSGRIWGVKEGLIQAGLALFAGVFIAVLFYDSPWGLLSLPFAYAFAGKCLRDREKKRRKKQLELEFKDYLYAVNGLLLAGQTAERAFVNGLLDVKQLYGEASVLVFFLGAMERRLKLQEPIEHILQDFAEVSESDDICGFVEVFCYAKRVGGDFSHLIATAVERICDKMDVMEEIRTVMAEKALEQKVMCIVPLGVLLFFKMTSPEFIGRLYGNLFGVLVMTAALALYAAAFLLGMRLVEIEV